MLFWFMGLLIGSGVTILVAWWFYRRSSMDTDNLKETILRAILGSPTIEKATHVDRSGEGVPKGATGIDILRSLDRPEKIRNRILQLFANNELYLPDLQLAARALTVAGKDIAEVASLCAKAGDFRLHGKMKESFQIEEQLKKKLRMMLKNK